MKEGKLRFNVTKFLRQCSFPEFRCLFRSLELYPWTQVHNMGNRSKYLDDAEYAENSKSDRIYAKKIASRTVTQIRGVFPILSVLDICTSIPTLLDPRIYLRWLNQLKNYFAQTDQPHGIVDLSSMPANYTATRSVMER